MQLVYCDWIEGIMGYDEFANILQLRVGISVEQTRESSLEIAAFGGVGVQLELDMACCIEGRRSCDLVPKVRFGLKELPAGIWQHENITHRQTSCISVDKS